MAHAVVEAVLGIEVNSLVRGCGNDGQLQEKQRNIWKLQLNFSLSKRGQKDPKKPPEKRRGCRKASERGSYLFMSLQLVVLCFLPVALYNMCSVSWAETGHPSCFSSFLAFSTNAWPYFLVSICNTHHAATTNSLGCLFRVEYGMSIGKCLFSLFFPRGRKFPLGETWCYFKPSSHRSKYAKASSSTFVLRVINSDGKCLYRLGKIN